MNHQSIRALCLSFLLWPMGVCLLQGQQTPSPGRTDSGNTVIRSTVRRVLVDVAVTDLFGQPVRGLTRADFSVRENGVQQRILSFEEHDHDAETFTPTAAPSLPSNSFVNLPPEPERGPLYLLLYDMANTGMEQQAVTRRKLVKFMENKPAGTRFALLVFSDGLHLIQGFTNDPRKLYQALDPHLKHPHIPVNFLHGENYGAHNSIVSLGILEDIRQFVQGLPGRKNLIWVSDQFPIPLFSPAPAELIDQARHELTALAKEQIAIYPLDDRGVAGGMIFLEQYALEDEIARLTGGHAVYSNNDLVDALTQATEAGASYYTISYNPTNIKDDGKLRRITLKTTRHGVELGYRHEYFADASRGAPDPSIPGEKETTPQPKPPTAEDTLYTDMRHGWPMSHDLLFGARIQQAGAPRLATKEEMSGLSPDPVYFKSRHKPGKTVRDPITLQPFEIDYTVPTRQLHTTQAAQQSAEDAAPGGTLEFAAAAYNADEVLLNGSIEHATPQTPTQTPNPAETSKPGTYRIQQQFLVPLGAAWIRVAVRDADTGRVGTLELSLPLAPEPSTTAQGIRASSAATSPLAVP